MKLRISSKIKDRHITLRPDVILTCFLKREHMINKMTQGFLASVLIFLLATAPAAATDVVHDWSRRFGSTDWEEGMSVTTDAAGNVYLTGFFNKTVNFGGSDLTSAGDVDIMLAKYLNLYSPLEVYTDIIPGCINLKGRGKIIVSVIRFPEAYDPHDIAKDSLELSIPSCPDCGVIFSNYEFPLHRHFMAFFPRQDLIDEIKTMDLDLPTELDLKVNGELNDGTPFEGLNTIRVIKQ